MWVCFKVRDLIYLVNLVLNDIGQEFYSFKLILKVLVIF